MDDQNKIASDIIKIYADMEKSHDYRYIDACRHGLANLAFKLAGMVLYDKHDKNNGVIKNG